MDTLRTLGRNMGVTHRSIGNLQRRGGYLPQLDRTRGFVTTSITFIAPFVTNNSNRKTSLSLDFTEGT